jgi:4,5-DOPA dioxygenase extradiol
MTTFPALFLGHGSPMNAITDNRWRQSWQRLGAQLPRPSAILCISAHWETHGTTLVTGAAHPVTIHDFGGFPDELFAVRYPAPGDLALAERTVALLGEGCAAIDPVRGFDHGAWSVVEPMYPAADIPLLQMSIDRALDPAAVMALAARLRPLRDNDVLIVGSGNIVHNLREWRALIGTQPAWAVDFQRRVNAAIVHRDADALTHFAAADEAAALAINSGEHYLPLLYTLGLRGMDEPVTLFNDEVDGSLSMTSLVIGMDAMPDSHSATTPP